MMGPSAPNGPPVPIAIAAEIGFRMATFASMRLRDVMSSLAKAVKAYPWGALWFIGKERGGRHAARLHQIVRGASRMVGLLPTAGNVSAEQATAGE